MVSRMIIQQRLFFEHTSFYVVLLLLLSCNKLVSEVISAAGDDTVKRGCMENEREALLEFKKGIVDNGGFLSSWGSEEDKRDCCKWRGIKCSNRTGHVVTLDLHNEVGYIELFGGKLSPSLLELQHLTYLDLSDHGLGESSIPNFIGSLSRLQYLDLRFNSLFGTIPHQIGNLTSLRSLHLGGYSSHLRVENLEWLSNLRLLGQLYLTAVDLGKVNWLQSINKLSFLSELHLIECELPGVPGIISSSLHLTNFSSIPLTTIDLTNNYFTSSSAYNWLFNFTSTLVEIQMSGNPFGGPIPDVFGNIMSLKRLYLDHGSLEGEIPKSLGNISSLRSLFLTYNNLTGQLDDVFQTLIASKNTLEILDLSSNKFHGSLPDFTIFSSLRELYLSGNKLQGSFPKSFGQTSLLYILDLSENKLNGRLPESIGQLSNLKVLYLSFNLLSLEFNSDWAPLFQLDVISLGNCKLGPHFPEWLRSQNNFSALDISSARISDTIPYWFWDLSPRLQYLNISNNQIHGMLPDLSLKFVTLPAIDLHSNRFKGSLPLLPHNMTSLNLSKNMFVGSIISLCKSMTKFLNYLDLSNNLLSSEVPDCWISAKYLEILDLANNNFSGEIPSSFGFIIGLQLLCLRNNNFTGEIPSSLKNCTYLKVVDMSENKLSGQVPAWIGTHLRVLVVLSFRRNEFHGSIPPSICSLNSTQVLDLSQNKISGNIPQCFNKLLSFIQTKSSSEITSFGFPGHELYTYYEGHLIHIYIGKYRASAFVQWKGRVSEYSNTLGLLKCIDLSSNKLVRKIPPEFASLEGLVSLNLSRNNLTGNIIQRIGQMKMLETLDLSDNQLFGEIPTSLASLNFLSVLNLSYNNFSGKIPSSTQLLGFSALVYAGNCELCGLPLPNKCLGEEELPLVHGKDKTNEEDEDRFVTIWFYVSVVLGFAVGFWGFLAPLLLRGSLRYAYFKLLDKIKDLICVKIAVNMARLKRKLRG